MVENPNNPVLSLDVQKMQTWVAPSKLMYQGDKGYIQPFRLTNAWKDYDVSANNLCFSASKPDGQVIEIENEPNRFTKEDDVWYFKLPDELTQAIGTVTCYFYVKDASNGIVASTTKFSYNVEAKFSDEEKSISYVSILQTIQDKFEDYLKNARQEVNEMTNTSNEYKQKLLKQLDDMTKQVNDWKAEREAAIDADISSRQAAIDQLNSDYQAKYNELVAKWNNQMVAEASQYSKDKADRDAEFQRQIKTITDQRDAKIAQIDSEWTAKKNALQSDIDNFKTDLLAEVQDANDKVKKLSDYADTVELKIDQLRKDFNQVNFDDFVTGETFRTEMTKKASGLKVHGLGGDYVMAVNTTDSNIDGTPNATAQSGLVDFSILSGALQVLTDAILDKNHYTKAEVDAMKQSAMDEINSGVQTKLDAKEQEITSLRRDLVAAQQEIQAMNNKIKLSGFSSDAEAAQWAKDHHGITYFED